MRIHNPFAECVLQQFLQYLHRYTVPCSSSFFYLQYTQGELGSGLTFILLLQIFLYFLKSICQQRELLLLLVAVAGKFLSFLLFVLGNGRVTGVTFIASHRRGVLRVYEVTGLTFIAGYQSRRFSRISFY